VSAEPREDHGISNLTAGARTLVALGITTAGLFRIDGEAVRLRIGEQVFWLRLPILPD
jgi:hypothetical protein